MHTKYRYQSFIENNSDNYRSSDGNDDANCDDQQQTVKELCKRELWELIVRTPLAVAYTHKLWVFVKPLELQNNIYWGIFFTANTHIQMTNSKCSVIIHVEFVRGSSKNSLAFTAIRKRKFGFHGGANEYENKSHGPSPDFN